MKGGTTALGTFRNQSGTNGSRTLGSILASDSLNGAGSAKRIVSYYTKPRHNPRGLNPFTLVWGINYGQFRGQARYLL
jgi:hypothetical protein